MHGPSSPRRSRDELRDQRAVEGLAARQPVLEFRRRSEAPARSLARREWSPGSVEHLSVELSGTVRAGSHARRVIADATTGVMARTEQDMFKLLVSELVNNAVQHGGGSGRASRDLPPGYD